MLHSRKDGPLRVCGQQESNQTFLRAAEVPDEQIFAILTEVQASHNLNHLACRCRTGGPSSKKISSDATLITTVICICSAISRSSTFDPQVEILRESLEESRQKPTILRAVKDTIQVEQESFE